jgi:hypothetical protein
MRHGRLVPAIHVYGIEKDVDARHIGERKRRRSSDGCAAMTEKKMKPHDPAD